MAQNARVGRVTKDVEAFGVEHADADKDGMDDDWEASTGLTDPDGDHDQDGYTNLEEFLNELAGDQDRSGNLINPVGAATANIPQVNCGYQV